MEDDQHRATREAIYEELSVPDEERAEIEAELAKRVRTSSKDLEDVVETLGKTMKEFWRLKIIEALDVLNARAYAKRAGAGSSFETSPRLRAGTSDSATVHTVVRPRNSKEDLLLKQDLKSQLSMLSGESNLETQCLICMDGFSRKQPGMPIPCSINCNPAQVHGKCIFEWREQQIATQPGDTPLGNCPLCRNPMTQFDYEPADVLHLTSLVSDDSARRRMAVSPAPPSAGMVRGYVIVLGYSCTGAPTSYSMFLQGATTRPYPLGPIPSGEGPGPRDVLLMRAQKTSRNCIKIGLGFDELHESFSRFNVLGKIAASVSGLDYTLTSEKKTELASVRYLQNRIGKNAGPRSLKACFAQAVAEEGDVSEYDEAHSLSITDHGADDLPYSNVYTIPHKPRSKRDRMRSVLKRRTYPASPSTRLEDNRNASAGKFVFAKNVEPLYVEEIDAFTLDFKGRVTLPSNKNFLLELEPSEGETMVFGKVAYRGDDEEYDSFTVYTLDFKYPLSPLQAFALALVSCDRKLMVA